MKSKYLSSHCIGWALGLMTAASFNSYHSKYVALISGILILISFMIADFSGPNDPVKKC